jgi:hypothetical protein
MKTSFILFIRHLLFDFVFILGRVFYGKDLENNVRVCRNYPTLPILVIFSLICYFVKREC